MENVEKAAALITLILIGSLSLEILTYSSNVALYDRTQADAVSDDRQT
jgi:hypothetical protein